MVYHWSGAGITVFVPVRLDTGIMEAVPPDYTIGNTDFQFSMMAINISEDAQNILIHGTWDY